MPFKRASSLVVGVSILVSGMTLGAETSNASPISEIPDALATYEQELAPLVSAIGQLEEAESEHSRSVAELREAIQSLDTALRILEIDRDRFSGVAVHAYMGRGGSTESFDTDSLIILAMSASRLRSDTREVESAESQVSRLSKAAKDAERITQERRGRVDQLEGPASAAIDELNNLISPAAPTLPGPAYRAYVRASSHAEELDPRCKVAPALLVGIGRIMSNHGRTKGSTLSAAGATDTELRGLFGSATLDSDGGTVDGSAETDVRVGPLQLTVAQWTEFALHDDRVIDSPEWLFSEAIAVARLLCSSNDDLRGIDGIRRAVNRFTSNSALTQAIIGSARQVARSSDIGLGSVPADPIQTADTTLLLTQVPNSDVTRTIEYLIAWSRLRLGTPYSQCQGPELRPDDPVCPPGTSRFGTGFFDCSGFVSAAYAAIGIALPTTTDAMAIAVDFGATKVGDEFDPNLDQPGDVLLMDGHVALSAGNSVIIHASGDQLTEEPIPTWVRNGVLGVYRPLLAN